jgi:hypothetical protein
MEHCWYKLNIDCKNALRSDWSLPDPEGKEFGIWSERADKMFNDAWLAELMSHGIIVAESLIFYRAPHHNTYNAHIDIHRDHPKRISTFGLNMIIDGEDSEMTWYKTPPITKTPHRGAAGTIYYNWPFSELEEIDRGTLGQELSIVRVGVPHGIIMNERPRWCISARAGLLENMWWKDIVKYMRDRNLLIEREDVQKD